MNLEEEAKFKELRHRFYRLAKHGPAVLEELLKDVPEEMAPNKDDIRALLFEIARRGDLLKLETLINKKETEILAQIGHVGDPCQYCGVTLDQVKPGPCPVRKKMVQI